MVYWPNHTPRIRPARCYTTTLPLALFTHCILIDCFLFPFSNPPESLQGACEICFFGSPHISPIVLYNLPKNKARGLLWRQSRMHQKLTRKRSHTPNIFRFLSYSQIRKDCIFPNILYPIHILMLSIAHWSSSFDHTYLFIYCFFEWTTSIEV